MENRRLISAKTEGSLQVCVSGASGFIGRALCNAFVARRYSVRPAVRSVVPAGFTEQRLDTVDIGEICLATGRTLSLKGVDAVIHAAGRAHVIRDEALDPLALYRCVNVQGSLNFARQAAASGVRRFVFISSIGVNGAFSDLFRPFANGDAPAPVEDYAVSKWEAEQGLWEISSQTGMEVVVVRPPLVYGPRVKGNLARLLDLVGSGVPLPLAAVNNQRSFIGLDNLVDLLIRCVDHPNAAGQTLLVSDGQDLSTPELLRMIANAMGRPARLFPVPVPLLRLAGRAFGRLNEVDRLLGSLKVDCSATQKLLGWAPPVGVEEGIKRMVAGTHKA